MNLPRLEIKLNESGREKVAKGKVTEMRDYDFLIDGYEIPALERISLDFGIDDIPTASFDFAVGELNVDAETINQIKAIIREQKQR